MAKIVRITSIGVIGANNGPEAANLFHTYYGELFFIVWMVVYLIGVTLYEPHLGRTRIPTNKQAEPMGLTITSGNIEGAFQQH